MTGSQTPRKGALLARWAAQRAQEVRFRAWLGVGSPEAATARIKEVCEIKSRRELDSDPHAMARFKGQIMRPYAEHCRQQGWSE